MWRPMKALAGNEGGGGRDEGGGRRRQRRALLSPFRARVLTKKLVSASFFVSTGMCFRALGVFVSGHKFYVCDFRTKHKICILAYHNLCFCVFVFLGMLHYYYFHMDGKIPWKEDSLSSVGKCTAKNI